MYHVWLFMVILSKIQNGQRPAFAGGASVTYNDKITWLLMLWQGKQKILIHGKFWLEETLDDIIRCEVNETFSIQ